MEEDYFSLEREWSGPLSKGFRGLGDWGSVWKEAMPGLEALCHGHALKSKVVNIVALF